MEYNLMLVFAFLLCSMLIIGAAIEDSSLVNSLGSLDPENSKNSPIVDSLLEILPMDHSKDFPPYSRDELKQFELDGDSIAEQSLEELGNPSILVENINPDQSLKHLPLNSLPNKFTNDLNAFGNIFPTDVSLEELISSEDIKDEVVNKFHREAMNFLISDPKRNTHYVNEINSYTGIQPLRFPFRTRHRRADDESSEQFRCVTVSDRLSRIWRQDKLSAVLEYIDYITRSSEPCVVERCRLQVDFSLLKSHLDSHFSEEVSGALQVTNTINSILHYEPERLSDRIYASLGRGLIQGSGRVKAVVMYFSDAEHSVVVETNRTSESGGKPDDLGEWPGVAGFSEFIQAHRDICAGTTDTTDQSAPVMTPQPLGSWGKLALHCASKTLHNVWVVPHYTPFFGCANSRLVVRGMLKVDVSLSGYDINQCSADSRDPFSNSHKCPDNFKCTPLPGHGFHSGGYRCDCLIGHHDNASLSHSLLGSHVQSRHVDWLLGNGDGTDVQCSPCGAGCLRCGNTSARCPLMYDSLTRGIPLGIESLCITLCVALTFAIVHLRKTKVMKASFWCLLEIVIIGAILLHLTVVVQYFEPTELLCLLVPWLREIGFTVVYGALILKVYRVLTGFQSRKAHRVEVRDKDLFKYLCCMIIICVSFMAAWTAVTLDRNLHTSSALLEYGYTEEDRLKYVVCRATWWDYIVEIGELTFMLFGVYLCYRARSAPSVCQELRFITVAICNETIVSAIFYVIRHVVWLTLHPDYIFLLYFARCQLTVTLLILLVFGPKLWYIHHPATDEPRRRAYSGCDIQTDNALSSSLCPEAVKLNSTCAVVGSSNPNGDVDVGEINLSDMNPDDIRTELKRLYTQLQIYKTKTMRQDNPHISKRRGGRKQTHRRFSLQAFHSKHHRHQHGSGGGGSGFGSDRGEVSVDRGDTEVSRTPEESTNSAEGVSIYMDEPSMAGGVPSVAETSVRTPTVTFKSTERLRGK